VNIRNPGIDELTLHIDHAINRIAIALIVSGGLVGSSILGVVNARGPQLIGVNLIAFLGFVISGVFGVWLIWGIVRSGRL